VPTQSVSVIEAGLATIGDVADVQAAAPAPEALTVIVTVEAPSDTTTVPPPNAAEGLTLRMVTSEPLTLALTLELLDAALSAPAALEMDTKAEVEQSVNVTVVGDAARLPPAPHEPVPAPVAVTAIGMLDCPSETVTVELTNAPDGLVRRIVSTLPVIDVVMAPLSAAAL
jgi:hypothetical protein